MKQIILIFNILFLIGCVNNSKKSTTYKKNTTIYLGGNILTMENRDGVIVNSQEVVFPGKFDRLLYEQGLIDTGAASFEQARLRARVNRLAYLHADSPDYSAKIRQ